MATKQATRQQRLDAILEKLRIAADDLGDLHGEIDESCSNMEGTNLESTERYQRWDEARGTLDEQHDQLESLIGELENIEF